MGSFGFILTGVDRSLDASSEPYLHRSAYAGGLDARKRFAGQLEISGSLDYSRVAGSRAAITRTQQSPVHLYQRPDDRLALDSTRTSLSGSSLELRFAKVGGKRLQFETAYQRRTPGFEINDIGFLLQADQQEWTSWAALAFTTPNQVFRQLRWNFNNWEYWNAAGLPTERAFNSNVHTQFNNRWWLHLGVRSARSEPPTATAALGADPRSDRTRTSPPGSASRATIARRSCRTCGSTTRDAMAVGRRGSASSRSSTSSWRAASPHR
jgi:hypothetical protein